MYPDMFNSPLRTPGKYVYSDLSMLFMKEVEENITQTPINVYVQKQFYTPLGMQTAGFLPLYRFNRDQIIPTEDDRTDRHALLHGDVHDPTAALLGGVAGHAGLFASANDVAILYQMVLNGGTYGGTQYLKPEIIKQFTAKYSANSRRGLGFDRWDPDLTLEYPSKLASPETFGHTGYTGTCIWVDPKSNLVYIFLSNRVHPKVSNKLSTLKVRGRIQDAIYGAIAKGL
jgi:CubicO group peptidase (beta-lactamase class C family)